MNRNKECIDAFSWGKNFWVSGRTIEISKIEKQREKRQKKQSRISKNYGTAIKGCDIYTVELADRKKKGKEQKEYLTNNRQEFPPD